MPAVSGPVYPSRPRRRLIGGVLAGPMVIVLALVLGLVTRQDHRWAVGEPPGAGPFADASRMLRGQARALLAGDEAGWLAPIDPSHPELRRQYTQMFQSLRALDVTQFSYRPELLTDPGTPVMSIAGNITYCLTQCTSGRLEPPDANQQLTVEQVGGRPMITAMVQPQQQDLEVPTPWESGPLVFRQGDRVTVAAPPNEAGYLDNMLTIAERSAEITDRFAGYLGNRPGRYRVYLADEPGYASWYGGKSGDGGVAYMMPLAASGADVVVRIDKIGGDRSYLPYTVRSQLARVVTLSGVTDYGEDDWLVEGVGEYIAWWPNPARSGQWTQNVRAALRSAHPPTTIAQPPLAANATVEQVRAFFGYGQLAADCMAKSYGEPALFAFVKAALQQRTGLDAAARQAFKKPFADVDRGCVGWIKQQVG
jgi:hypothetical protein